MSNSGGLTFLSLHPFVRATVVDKVRGAIVGAALGDCIGLYTEFLSKQLAEVAYPTAKFQLVEPATQLKNDGHRNKFSSKSWTDDTDHALLIILSYLHHDGQLLPDDLAKRLRTWAEQGLRCLNRPPSGLGRTVGRVVFGKAYLKDPTKAAYDHWVHSAFNAAPNGSLMRTHPLGVICIDKTRKETFRIAAEFSLVTHADPRCVVACCILTALIRGILRGEVRDEKDVDAIVYVGSDWVQTWQKKGRRFDEGVAVEVDVDDEWVDASLKTDDEVDPLLPSTSTQNKQPPASGEPFLNRNELYQHTQAKTFQELQLDDALKMGYVYKSLGAAILALRLAIRSNGHSLNETTCRHKMPSLKGNINLFETIITDLVMEAGDADTNASIAGALLGAWFGYTALPLHWRDGLAHSEWLIRKCDGLSYTIGIIEPSASSNKGSGSDGKNVSDPGPAYKGSQDPDTREDGGRGFLDQDALEAREMALLEGYFNKMAGGTNGGMREGERGREGWRGRLFSR